MEAPSPWHRGEIDAQRRAAVDPAHVASMTAYMRRYLNDQHRAFYPRLPFIVVGVVDAQGRPWATILEGRPGFMAATDDRHLRIAGTPAPDDPAAAGMALRSAVGLLGIELSTRRRNRLNGHVAAADGQTLLVEVDTAYGNCPKYIHTRELQFHAPGPAPPSPAETAGTLDGEARRAIVESGTFFVASAIEEPVRAVDVSHRGGRPGFVDVDGDCLSIPDFQGNQFFNTLGNFLVNPKAGLLFPDFRTGDVLQLTGTVDVAFDGAGIGAFDGAERMWRFHVEQMVRRRGALRWRGDVHEAAAEVESTGTWRETGVRLAEARARGWRRFRVQRSVQEAADVRSFELRPAGGGKVIGANAGMHLVVRLPSDADGPGPTASYSLSRMPSGNAYRISIKLGGATSRRAWTALQEGASIEVRGPQGEFAVDTNSPRPVVLVSAGIGITPLLAMAEQLIEADGRLGRRRRVHFIHGARDGASMPFQSELAALQRRSAGHLGVVRCFSRPSASDRPGIDFEFAGRVGLDTLRQSLHFDDHDFYLCGPGQFMQQLYDGLRSMNIGDARIRAEAFGPSALRRDGDEARSGHEAATAPVEVAFTRAGRQVDWLPGSGTLLELAERSGLTPEYGCRNGTCGTCRTKVLSGHVAYPGRPLPDTGEDTALICCAVPAAPRGDDGTSSLRLDL